MTETLKGAATRKAQAKAILKELGVMIRSEQERLDSLMERIQPGKRLYDFIKWNADEAVRVETRLSYLHNLQRDLKGGIEGGVDTGSLMQIINSRRTTLRDQLEGTRPWMVEGKPGNIMVGQAHANALNDLIDQNGDFTTLFRFASDMYNGKREPDGTLVIEGLPDAPVTNIKIKEGGRRR